MKDENKKNIASNLDQSHKHSISLSLYSSHAIFSAVSWSPGEGKCMFGKGK